MSKQHVRFLEPSARPKDEAQDFAGVTSLTPSLQHQQPTPAATGDGGPIRLAATFIGGGNEQGLLPEAAVAPALSGRQVASLANAQNALHDATPLDVHALGPQMEPLGAPKSNRGPDSFEKTLCELLQDGPKTFKELYPLVAARQPEHCSGLKIVSTAHLGWLYDLERDLRSVAVNLDGIWHLKKNILLQSSSRAVEQPVRRDGKRSKKGTEKAIPLDLEKLPSKNFDSVPANKDTVVAPATFATLSTKSTSDGKGTPMISKEALKEILSEGKEVSDEKYNQHCRFNQVKTFYYFCSRLALEPANIPISARDLNEFITAGLRRRNIVVKNRFNAKGWFGRGWTNWNKPLKKERHFRREYCEVLVRTVRTGRAPYSYQLSPDYLEMVREILAELEPAT